MWSFTRNPDGTTPPIQEPGYERVAQLHRGFVYDAAGCAIGLYKEWSRHGDLLSFALLLRKKVVDKDSAN